MKKRQMFTFWTALVLVLLVAAGPALAARFDVGHTKSRPPECDESDESDDDECSDAASGGPNGGPKHCNWPTSQTGNGLLQCLGEVCGEDADGDGFDVGTALGDENNVPNMTLWMDDSPGCTPQGANPGPEEEIFSFCFRENGDVIGYVLIEVEQPNLVAKIHKFIERPGRTGEIRIEINDDLVVVDVGPAMGSVDKLNKQVCLALGRDFRVTCLDDFFVVYADSLGQTPQLLSLSTAQGDVGSTTYSGLSTTEIALEPIGGHLDVTACSEPSASLLLTSPR